MVIRAIKKLDSKCRRPRFLSCFPVGGQDAQKLEGVKPRWVFRNRSGEVLPFQIGEHSIRPQGIT
jgi:hypothetical protein